MKMKFEDLINSLKNPGENEPPATILDDLKVAYDADIASRDNRVNELSTNLVASNNTVVALQDDLHKASMTIGAPQGSGTSDDQELDEIERGRNIRIDDLFTKRKV